jgi:1-acyl-sn-glycerol-3-phosphate acyltransferase
MWQLGVFVASIYLALLLPVVSIALLVLNREPTASLFAWVGLVITCLAAILPLEWTDKSPFIRWLLKSSTRAATDYFPIQVILEDKQALGDPSQQYVIGYEPHSALPTGIPAVFSSPSPSLPTFLRGPRFHSLASSICFAIPFVRQLWYGLGLRPADRGQIERLLKGGGSILLCPGGVQECVLMEHHCERIYLRKRKGFIRMAIKHGAALVPVFAFGQRDHYHWYRAPLPAFISRALGAAPILMWGIMGTPIPHRSLLKIVVGAPITTKVEGKVQEDPSDEMVSALLDKFIESMQRMYEKHGPPGIPLEVI